MWSSPCSRRATAADARRTRGARMAGPIDSHPLRHDPVSAAAVRAIPVGDLELIAVSDGFFRLPKDFLGTAGHPAAAYDALAAVQGPDVRLPVGCFLVP